MDASLEWTEAALGRRDALRLPLLAALRAVLPASGLTLAGCNDQPRPQPSIPAAATGIDVHCHVFNARDLPIPGFVLHVVLEKDPLASLQLGALVTFLALLIDSATRGADAEIAHLEDGSEAGFRVAATPSIETGLYYHALMAALELRTPSPRSTEIMARVGQILPSAQTTRDARGIEPATSLLRQLAVLTPGGPVPGIDAPIGTSGARVAPASPGTVEADAEAAARGVVRHAENRSGIFYLAELVTRPRAELVGRLVALPSEADNSGIALFTPAMIDFSFWLDHRADDPSDPEPAKDPADVTALADQVKVMSRIAGFKTSRQGVSRQYAVHPFVSFCPWRQIAEQARLVPKQSQQFQIVRDAIRTKGFVGIKLYPVMGFRPIGNSGEVGAGYPRRLRSLPDWAGSMDRALADLYQFCTDEDVPIMAHCSFSQYPNVAAGLRGGPAGWWEVLERWPKLRLNLAHCGGVWNLAPGRSAPGQGDRPFDAWSVDIIARLGRAANPNLYADLADFDGVLACQPVERRIDAACRHSVAGEPVLKRLSEEVGCNPLSRKRIMYGTDYMFLIQASGTEDYFLKNRDCLAPLLGMEKADLMGLNAARFLGLTDRSTGTRQRLDRFRADDFLDRWTV